MLDPAARSRSRAITLAAGCMCPSPSSALGAPGSRRAWLTRRARPSAACAAGARRRAAAARLSAGARWCPYIVGGQEASISQFPWQVFVRCSSKSGGYILGAGLRRARSSTPRTSSPPPTASIHEDSTTTYPADGLDGRSRAPPTWLNSRSQLITPPGSQARRQVSQRPRRTPTTAVLPNIKDDVAVLELSQRRSNCPPTDNAQPIPLVATGATPAPGTALSRERLRQTGTAPKQRRTERQALLDHAHRDQQRRLPGKLVGVNSAVLLCAPRHELLDLPGRQRRTAHRGQSRRSRSGIVDFGARLSLACLARRSTVRAVDADGQTASGDAGFGADGAAPTSRWRRSRSACPARSRPRLPRDGATDAQGASVYALQTAASAAGPPQRPRRPRRDRRRSSCPGQPRGRHGARPAHAHP